ncbi:hypothetical protein [Paraflavitalea speifideaquila]|uniref:hypothetical protein n=1 Tax=Paraflavitalea speifideaquila TaxID=3076558 RepID=UPI0028E7236B|nr:hypothetical protein [Paraflavitalea speifideiaquila]
MTAFLVLAGIAQLLMWLVRRFFPSSWSYLWRQGFANLYRPNNQTLILITTIGLGALFISTLYFIQTMLINRVSLTGSGSQPNMVLFDIQSSQKDSVAALAKQYQLPVLQQVPIVTMRIEAINGKTAADVKKIPPPKYPNTPLNGSFALLTAIPSPIRRNLLRANFPNPSNTLVQ